MCVCVCWFSEGGAVGQSVEERQKTVAEVQAVLRVTGFPFYIVPLEQVSEDVCTSCHEIPSRRFWDVTFTVNGLTTWTDQTDHWMCPSSSTGSGPSYFGCGVGRGTFRAAKQLLQSSRGSLHPEWWQQQQQQQPFDTAGAGAGAGANIPAWGSGVTNTDPAAADCLS